jgi:hypothetical protein
MNKLKRATILSIVFFCALSVTCQVSAQTKDYFHTGLQVSRSEIASLKNNLNPSYKLYVKKGSGVSSPAGDIYEGGNNENDGLSWDTAFATIAKAISTAAGYINWSASPWATNIEIHIAPGTYAENLTSLPHGAALIGYGDAWDADGERGVKIKPASGSPVDVGAFVNGLIYNIGFESVDTSRVFDATILNNVQIIHCRFAGAPEATTSTAGIYASDSVMLTIRDSRFEYVDCGIDFVYVDGGDSVTRLLVDRNFFMYISEAGIRFSLNLVTPASRVCNNFIGGGGQTLAIGIDNNVATPIVHIDGNIISATDGIEGYTTGTYVGGNYCNGVLE